MPNKPKSSTLESINTEESAFIQVAGLIAASREKALQVNTALSELHWEIGGIISRKIAAAEWGDAVVDRLAAFISRTEPGLRGFTRCNLFRMKQFYEAYREDLIAQDQPAAESKLHTEPEPHPQLAALGRQLRCGPVLCRRPVPAASLGGLR